MSDTAAMTKPQVTTLEDVVAEALAHEVAWSRDPHAPGAHYGVHPDEAPPWNRARGPLHARGGVAGVVRQHGREIAAWGDAERADQTFSVAKTYLALLAGVAHGRGLLGDVDEPVVSTLAGIGFDSAHNRGVTWRHLLEQTSEWEGSCFGIPDTVDRWRQVAHDPRPAAGRKGQARPLQPPGSYWEYNDIRINQLALALLHLFREPLESVFLNELLRPLGGGDGCAWEPYDDAWVTIDGRRLPSVPGGTHWGGGVRIAARDQERIGQLLLDDGVHAGRRLLPAGWVERMRTPCRVAPFYGWLVWLNRDGRAFPGASADAMFMQGAGGHTVWIDPGLDAVVVVRWLDPAHEKPFVRGIAAALAAAR